jgi:hypothetical protein
MVSMLFIIVRGRGSLHESKEENPFKSVGESTFNLIFMSSSPLEFINLFCCRDSSPLDCDFYSRIYSTVEFSSTLGFILL